ncbi:type IV pilin protein [Legionella fallonii]|uniref:type IV pilin protein n=1 Tax=Legionella fallonii TaxID=96230 RepID=UPI0005D3D7ED|nr:type IV pilin protein [Legionella fallonii]
MQGFTLVELLITLIIVGILVTIAYPSYKAYLMKSRRSDALQTLTQDQLILERCYSTNFSYSTACGALPAFPQTSTQGFYSITISNLGTSTYTLTATPIGSQAQDTTCANISVNQANARTANNSSNTSQSICWNPT